MNQPEFSDQGDEPHLVNQLVGDGWSRLEVAAIAMHEAFLALVSSGFTEGQALDIISKIVIASRPRSALES